MKQIRRGLAADHRLWHASLQHAQLSALIAAPTPEFTRIEGCARMGAARAKRCGEDRGDTGCKDGICGQSCDSQGDVALFDRIIPQLSEVVRSPAIDGPAAINGQQGVASQPVMPTGDVSTEPLPE